MSNQVTNVDIEDVLSSIRRLVAEGDQKSRAAPIEYSAEENAPDKLVLTPNFRVEAEDDTDDSDPHEEAIASDVVEDDQPVEPEALVLQPEQSIPDGEPIQINRDSLEATVAGLEARVSEAGQQWEPDGSEFKSEPTWTSTGFAAIPPEAFPAEPEDIDPAEADLTPDAALDFQKPEEAAPEVQQLSPVDPDVQELSEAEAIETPGDSEDTATVDEAFVPHPRPHRWSEQAERRLTPTLQDDDAEFGDDLAPAPVEASDEHLVKYLEQGGMVDEAALKRVVQEVLREELQGQLGERITRNVRKLVRREIHNILTTQEFE